MLHLSYIIGEWCCSCVLSRFSCVRLFVTPWTIARQAPLCIRVYRQEYYSGLPYPPPGELPDPGIELMSLKSPALAGGFFTTSTTLVALKGAQNASLMVYAVGSGVACVWRPHHPHFHGDSGNLQLTFSDRGKVSQVTGLGGVWLITPAEQSLLLHAYWVLAKHKTHRPSFI